MIARTAALQAPLSMGILQARILEWVAIPFSGDLPDPGTELKSALQADSSPSEPPGKHMANLSAYEKAKTVICCARGRAV